MTDSVRRQSEHKKTSGLKLLLCHIMYMSERVLCGPIFSVQP